MELQEFEKMKVKRTLNDVSVWIKRIFLGLTLLLIVSLFISNLILTRKVSKLEQKTEETILAVKQDVQTITESKLRAINAENFKRDSNLVELVNKLQLNIKDLNTVIQITTKSTRKFEKQIGTIKGEIEDTKSLLIKIDSTLKVSGDTLNVGLLDSLFNNVPCNPKGTYHFWDYGTNFKWDAWLDFDKDTFFLTPKYESVLTLLTTRVSSGFLGLKSPTFKVTVASDDPYATYTINGATIIPPKTLLSVGIGMGYGVIYNKKAFALGPSISLGIYKNIFSLYRK